MEGLACAAAVFGVTGRRPRVHPRRAQEQRKALFALALEGDRAILLDNVTRAWEGGALRVPLTAGEIWDRALGAAGPRWRRSTWSRDREDVPLRGRLPCALVARQVPTVERRRVRTARRFRRPRLLLGHVRPSTPASSRRRSTPRAYHVAGRPGHGCRPWAPSESWDALVRGTCLWAGVGDPLACRERVESVDEDRERLAACSRAWHGAFGSTDRRWRRPPRKRPRTNRSGSPSPPSTPRGYAAHPNVASIANRPKTLLGRIVEGRRLERVGKTSRRPTEWGSWGSWGLIRRDSNTHARAHARSVSP